MQSLRLCSDVGRRQRENKKTGAVIREPRASSAPDQSVPARENNARHDALCTGTSGPATATAPGSRQFHSRPPQAAQWPMRAEKAASIQPEPSPCNSDAENRRRSVSEHQAPPEAHHAASLPRKDSLTAGTTSTSERSPSFRVPPERS